MSEPLVTIAIPLYRSRRFVDVIAANIARIGLTNAEILISDRHQDDDALAVLGARFADDARVRCLGAHDRIGWVAHYNHLVQAARGRYFTWMPHDDDISEGFVEALVACLERDPAVVLAYPRVAVVGTRGPVRQRAEHAPRDDARDMAGRTRAALDTLMFESHWLPQFHGVFRRAAILERGLAIRGTTGDVEADLYWVFAVGLVGALREVRGATYTKRIHDTNASRLWGRRDLRHVRDGLVLPLGYVRDLAARRELVRAAATLAPWSGLRAIGCLTQAWSWPSRATRERVREQLRRLRHAR